MRRAVSLIEVLFAILIVAVGLLGTLSLLAVGGANTSAGLTSDMADRCGRSAIRSFDVRGMRQAGRWTAPLNPNVSYFLDPMFVAANGAAAPANLFPSIPTASAPGARMVRMSLKQDATGIPLSLAVAEVAFLFDDDLVVDLPSDRTLLPVQKFSPARRAYEGRISWAASITPKDPGGSDFYVISVVVFNRRDLTLPPATPSGTEPDTERIVDITFHAGGLAGGEVRLTARSGRPVADVEARDGQWLMLAGWKNITWNGVPVVLQRFGWYKVLAINAVQAGDDYVDATLFGQDWDQALATQAVLVNGVVAVYEKTMRLESM